MAMDIAVRYVMDEGPLTPEELDTMFEADKGSSPGENYWESVMKRSKELVEDDSGRFHLKDNKGGPEWEKLE